MVRRTDFHWVQWVGAVEDVDLGKPKKLIDLLRSKAEIDADVRELLADLLDRRHLPPRPRVSDEDIDLISAAEAARERLSPKRVRLLKKQRGQQASSIQQDVVKKVAKGYRVTEASLRNVLNGKSRAAKRLRKLTTD